MKPEKNEIPPDSENEPMPRLGLKACAVAIILLSAHFILAVSGIADKSSTVDESLHLTAGFSYWRYDDYRFQPENGNLPQRLAALPLLLEKPAFPSFDSPGWKNSDVWKIGARFLFHMGNDFAKIIRQGRMMMVLLSLMLGGIVFAWSRRLFGVGGGLISLFLYALCPNMLAHAPLATSDVAAALFFVAATGMLWMMMHRLSWATCLGTGICLGGLMLSKMSGIVIAPVALCLLILRMIFARPLRIRFLKERAITRRPAIFIVLSAAVLLEIAIACSMIWAAYGFRYSAFNENLPVESSRFLYDLGRPREKGRLRDNSSAVGFMKKHRLLPESFTLGV